MISYEIRRDPKKREVLHLPTTKEQEHPTTLSGRNARKAAIFDEQFTAFWGNVGDKVIFKNTTKNRVEWIVKSICLDWRDCKWTKGGKRPLFIELERKVLVAGNRPRTETVWTCTDVLQEPDMKGKWRV